MQAGYQWWAIAILFLTALVNLVLGLLVVRSGKSAQHRWFLGVAVSSSVWMATNAVFPLVSGTTQQFVALLSYGAAAAIATTFLKFSFEFIGHRVGRAVFWVYWVIGTAVVVMSMIPGVLLVEVGPSSELITNTAPLVIYGAFLIGSLAIGMAVVAYGYKSSRGQGRRQARLILTGAIIAGIIGIFFNLIAPLAQSYSFVQLGPLGVVVFLGVTAYAIARYGMFDVRAAVARTSMYTMSFIVLSGIYVVLAYGFSAVLLRVSPDELGAVLNPLNVILAVCLVFLFQPVRRFFDQLTNKIFYRGDYDRDTFFRELGKVLSYDTDLQLLLKQASSYIASNMGVERVFFYITGRGVYHGAGPRKRRLPDEDIATIAKYYKNVHEFPEAIVADSVESEEVKRVLASHQSSVVLPLILQGEAIGYLLLGEHKARGYTVRDIRALESVANELTIAVRNSLSVEEVRELNETLQRRIDDATKELRTSNQQLQRLDEAKDEFISMASHQLRTPLTSIKGYLDMVLQGDLGRVSATQKAVLSEAFISSERMVTLINDFLNVSRLQTGKFMIERRESDLAEAMKGQLQMLDIVAKQHRLTLKHKIGKDVPLVKVDIDKIRQVMLNMIDNAIFYSKLGTSVQISLLKEGDDIVFRVKDTGIGVPEAEQVGLFGKFFRATNARRKRPDGTGIGLFLAKKVILAHGGEMIFESKEGRGSTFGFRLPIA